MSFFQEGETPLQAGVFNETCTYGGVRGALAVEVRHPSTRL